MFSATRRRALAIAATVLAGCLTPFGSATTASASDPNLCKPVFIGIPGSGQAGGDSAQMDAIFRRLDALGDLQPQVKIGYPAVPVYKYANDLLNFTRVIKGTGLEVSEKKGVELVRNAIRDARHRAGSHCVNDNVPILIAGYSQGAEVAVRSIQTLSSAERNTVRVALLGNPSFWPRYSYRLNLNGGASAAFVGVRRSLLAGAHFDLPKDVATASRALDICAGGDPICAYWPTRLPSLAVSGTGVLASTHYKYGTLKHGGATLTDIAANFLWAHRSASPAVKPQPSPPPPAATYAEQQGRHGVNTFLNYHNASGLGPKIDPASWVQVSCKVYDPFIVSANPDGYWYRIASSPWNNAYYSPANTFMNGDPWGGPFTHNTDFTVPDC